jgi:hypothetical protein
LNVEEVAMSRCNPGLCLVAYSLLLICVSGCQHYYADETVRHTAVYNAVPERAAAPFPGAEHADILLDPTATNGGLNLAVGGRYENDAYDGVSGSAGGDRFDAAALRLGYTGGTGAWRWGVGLRRPGSFNYSLGAETAPNLETAGDLWALGAALGWGRRLRLGLGAEGLYGYLSYRNSAADETAVELQRELLGWRSRLGLRFTDGDWNLGLTAAAPAKLGYGPGLPWGFELWTTIPLTGYRDESFDLEIALGGSLYNAEARLRGENDQDLSGLLADSLHGALALAWTTAGDLGVRIGGRLGAYPLLGEDADPLLTQNYGLQLAYGSKPRWRLSGVYGLIGGLADDAYAASRLELQLELTWD